MQRRRIVLIAALAVTASLLVSFPALAAPSRQTPASPLRRLANFAATGSHLIRLQAGAFDPLRSARPSQAKIPVVAEAALPAAEPVYWLVQAADRRFLALTSSVRAAGAAIAGYLPDDTYLVRATPRQRRDIAASPAVRWSGLLEPAWKVPVATPGQQALVDRPGSQTYRVYTFRADPAALTIGARLASIPGVTLLTKGESRVVDVRATAAELPAIAAVPFVQWLSLKPVFKPLNSNARWVIDTGVRDLFAATAPNGAAPGRLTGAGQTAGDADTPVNYKPDSDGFAHVAFRDCSDAAGKACKEADWTQTAPGNSNALMEVVQRNNAPSAPHRKMAAYFDVGQTGVEPIDPSSHGTHTAGSVTGDAGAYGRYDGEDGLAPGARLVFQNILTPTGGLSLPSDYYELFRQAYRPGDPSSVDNSGADPNPADYGANYKPLEDARTHNNSYGNIFPILDPLSEASAIDQFVWDHEDMDIAVAAGNAGPEAGSIGAPAVAKNDFTSGASSNGRQPMVSIDSMTNFSSHGPTGDGRYGITVATPGEVVIGPKGGTTDAYQYLQGTSMSTPVLTGALTLVRQYFWDGYGPANGDGFAGGSADAARRHNPSAALVKAAVVNGAERMTGWYTGDSGGGAEASQRGQYPSGGQGFGRMNLDNSLYFTNDALNNWYHDVYRADSDALDTTDQGAARQYTVHVGRGQPLEVSLAYTDAPNVLPAGTPSLTNDLDLVVTGPGGTYVGNNFNTRATPSAPDAETPAGQASSDAVNNVEKVRIASPAAGDYTISVRATKVVLGKQGFALAASGPISAPAGPAFAAGPPRQADVVGLPSIENVKAVPVSADTVKVTFDTSEPTTATATGLVKTESHTFTDVFNVGTESYYGIATGPVETSARTANKPVLGIHHEITMTGFDAGSDRTFVLSAQDLNPANAPTTAPVTFTTPANVFQPVKAQDQGQLRRSGSGDQWTVGKQFYAGHLPATLSGAADDLLGAFMFRLPESFEPSTITGASVEMTSGHDLVSHGTQDPLYTVDLLDNSVKANWGTQTYNQIHSAAAAARFTPETALHRGGLETYAFTLSCSDLQKLKDSLAADRKAPFRWDVANPPEDEALFSMDFGFNRRSRGVELRPKLVLQTTSTSVQPPITPCGAATPAPAISDIGVHRGVATSASTVTWRTDIASDSLVLFREKGTSGAFIQVGAAARTTLHQVEVQGLDPSKNYEFGVRSTGCNGKATTDDNAGAGYSFRPQAPPSPPPSQATTTYYFHGTATDDTARQAGTSAATATFDTTASTGTTDRTQTGDPTFSDSSAPGDPFSPYWVAPYPAQAIEGNMHLSWYWSTPNPEAIALGTDEDVTVWTAADKAGPWQLLGAATTSFVNIDTTPTLETSDVHVRGDVLGWVLIQASPHYFDAGQQNIVHYDSTSTASKFDAPVGPEPPPVAGFPRAGPVPPQSAGDHDLNMASVATDDPASPADVAAGTGRCVSPKQGSLGGAGQGAGGIGHDGYRLTAADGGVFAFGDAAFLGSMGSSRLRSPVVGMAATPSGAGYWLVGADGGVFAFGDAAFHGSLGGISLDRPVVGITATADGGGYWLVTADGRVFAFGNAAARGSMAGQHLNQPIVGMASTAVGRGYWLVASDGGVFAFGDAVFHGSTGGIRLNKPVVGMAATAGGGYWLVATDGGVFAFGDAVFHGSTGSITLNKPVVGMASTASTGGYWLVATDGGVFAFGDAVFRGSTGSIRLNSPMTAMARS